VDGVALGSWQVTALSISVGGWNTGNATTDTIDSITLPGDVTATPLPGTLSLFAGGIGLIVLLARRKKPKNAFALAA
jgi:hypothetical protein